MVPQLLYQLPETGNGQVFSPCVRYIGLTRLLECMDSSSQIAALYAGASSIKDIFFLHQNDINTCEEAPQPPKDIIAIMYIYIYIYKYKYTYINTPGGIAHTMPPSRNDF